MDYKDKKWFENQFIFLGKSLGELSKELGMDWTSLDRWREIHNLPRHSQKETILDIYGESVFENIKKRKSRIYQESNKRKARRGIPLSSDTKEKISKALSGKTVPDNVKELARQRQLGINNTNYKGGFYSSCVYPEIDRNRIWSDVAQVWNRLAVVEKNYTCDITGKQSFDVQGHHVVSFSHIFNVIARYLFKKNALNTFNVIQELNDFHKNNLSTLYIVVLKEIHADIHRMENSVIFKRKQDSLIHLLSHYANPEPSLKFEEGAETIERVTNRVE